MKHLLQVLLITLGGVVTLNAMSMPAPQSKPSHPSVHEMFQNIPQDDLLAMMEEGQQFIKYLEENGTAEEKMAFAQAMEETLQSFTEDDWKEFEMLAEAVQDKLPPLVLDTPEEVKPTPAKETPKEKPVKVDNTLEKILRAIHKAVHAILLKAKSDKVLMERITIAWDNKDDFNEMIRLLQAMNKEDLIIKITKSSDDDTKLLLESIQNFNKRLQIENDQFVIADTFGLQADEKTTALNLKKLNKILEFFDSAVSSLLPKIIKFMQTYEPEALKKAQMHDEDAKKALEHAQKVEKQKRPSGNGQYHARNSLHGSPQRRQEYKSGGYPQHAANKATQHPHSYLEDIHQANIEEVKSRSTKASSKQSGDEKKSDQKKENKKSAYDKSIDALESHLESFNNQDLGAFTATISKANTMFKPFGNALQSTDKDRAESLTKKRDAANQLTPQEKTFLQQYNDQTDTANKDFVKHTQQAHLQYEELKESFGKLYPQVDDMMQAIQSVKGSLDQMTAKELDQLYHSKTLKNFSHRINIYYDQFRTIQNELKNKHRLHALERENPYEKAAYEELATKIASLHGLDRKIADVKSQFTALEKSMKGAIARKKREENKAAVQS